MRAVLPFLLVLIALQGAAAQETKPEAAAAAQPKDAPAAVEPAAAEPAAAEPAVPAAEEEPGPWRLSEALGLPEWLHVGGTYRTRYAYVGNQFRAGPGGDNHALSVRTTIKLELRFDPVHVGAELQDSRAYFVDDQAPLSTSVVNPVELLQAYLTFKFDEYLPPESTGYVRAGRLTVDFGSRRLVARNRFRNTINAFTGAEGYWESATGFSVHGLFALPIQRRPENRDALEDNDIHFDHEQESVTFWGLFTSTPKLTDLDLRGEVYVFGLNERDSSERATRDREIYTPGFRVNRKKAVGKVDFELEAALQFGNSRSSGAASNTTNLDHLAFFVHAALAYTLDVPTTPRLILQYDYASGDHNPNDGDNERFDTLFGARRFEYGPTGIFGAIARSNLNSPSVRVEFSPHERVQVMTAYRAFWLASKKDAWTAAGVRDPNGDSGRFVGHQLETRIRWEVVPGNVRLEFGAAALIRGHFARSAPNATKGGEHLFAYSQIAFTW